MTHETIGKAYAYQILKEAYPLKPGDTVTFLISEALFVLEYQGSSDSADVNLFIERLRDNTRRW